MSCTVSDHCLNTSRCADCAGRYPLPQALEIELPLLYDRVSNRSPLHPIVEARRKNAADSRVQKREAKKAKPDFNKRKRILKASQKTEQDTRDQIIRATVRSGAAHGDGDSRIGDGRIGIDDKMCSTVDKTVSLSVEEIDKASKQRCIVVVTLKNGRKFAVASLPDFINAAAEIAAIKEQL